MTVEGLLSLRGNTLTLVKAEEAYGLLDLIRAKKEAGGILDTKAYDTNSDGVVDSTDITNIRKALLNSGGEV